MIVTYQSKPTLVEAAQWLGEGLGDIQELALHKIRIDPATRRLELRAGKDGVQGWVPVPVGHWVVRNPGDASDLWPVEEKYFDSKYEPTGEMTVDDLRESLEAPHGGVLTEERWCPPCGRYRLTLHDQCLSCGEDL